MFSRRDFLSTAAALGAASVSGPGFAQATWPNKPLRLVVPYPAGGGVDTLARVLAIKLQDALGQQVIIDNRPGGNTVIGGMATVNAPADGYTMVWMTSLGLLSAPLLVKDIPYQPMKELTPVAMLAISPHLVCANPNLAARNLPELIALSKAKPGSIRYATAGLGSMAHLAMEELRARTGADFTHIPYKGDAPGLQDVLGGTIELICTNLSILLPQVKAGALRPITVTSAKRLPQLPDVGAASEVSPGFEVTVFNAMLVKTGTPQQVIERLNAEFVKILALPDIKERLDGSALLAGSGGPDEVLRQIMADDKIVRRVITENKITAD